MTSKINTVNVIEYANDNLVGIQSFLDTPEGNKEAEQAFTSILKEDSSMCFVLTDEEIEACIEDGYFEQGDYQLFISHSN